MRVAVVAGPDAGHVFPAVALCLRFAAAGDEPVLLSADGWRDAAVAAGVEVPPLEWLALRHEADIGRWLYERAAELARQLVPTLKEIRPDLVVSDVLATCGGMAAELSGLPWVELSPHPLYLPSRGLPPIGTGLAPGVGVRGRLRDAVLRLATARSLRQGHRQRATARAGIGLPATDPGPAARLIATLPALEVPRPDWPREAHVVGPLLWDPIPVGLTPPPGAEPLVMIAPSTATGGAADMLSTTLAALDGLGVRAAVSAFQPPNDLPAWARAGAGGQDDLLRQASVVVCGAGHGLLAKALLAGVPVVAVPGGGDQWELANRAARQGSAVVVRPPAVDAIRDAVARVLGDPTFRAAAGDAAKTVADVADPVMVCRSVI
ncbi:glycosyltransferase [Kutzneria kofuensis]|uniref:UDP:flavonoid glycosyltransferase YjiC (YdhE family) n=1 Tax=Kutzneria kofuensis TaxID=103725 RepID=A0A7W9KBF6_9PSEU|nr:nucleotide disphospho-sugar-binding domain-containing protein [Kutzneria kofuensis]MBB5889530.1 UDP:flavonoid glycosyltransferase YjiC (YdhE family) [Kutzneria kofuensis]